MEITIGIAIFLVLLQSSILYLVSRASIQTLSNFFHRLIHSKRVIFWMMSLIFLPGTVVHEMSHFLAATVLFLRVQDLKIFPTFEENQIKLGHVIYEKKDVFRAILVGIAPFFGGLAVFLMLYYFQLFPSTLLLNNILYGYFVFAVSTTMFSSKQDLKDAVFILPLLIIILGVMYILNIRVDFAVENTTFINGTLNILGRVNFYLFLSIIINLIMIAALRGVQLLIGKTS